MNRGGQIDLEIEHGRLLLRGGAANIWGWESPAGQLRVQRRVKWLSSACRLGPGVRVLECGCGTGIFTRHLAKSGAKITAMDISQDLLAHARTECSAPNVVFLHGNLESPDVLHERYFDVMCGVSVLHHLNVVKALKALRNKLKPTGRFAFSEPNLLNPINKYYIFTQDAEKRRARGTSPTEMAFRPDELRQIFNDAGYQLENLEMRDFMHPAISKPLIPIFKWIERNAEAMPFVKLCSGSIWVYGSV
jgi:2-polyprenyl-3-methyl-5-hydroxy-6-metoxy-1,4-benzoquinol methylase